MMDQLRQLVRNFASGQIEYRQFRRELAPFISQGDQDPVLGKVCEFIESECSAFEHGILNDYGLRLGLNMQFAWAGVGPRTTSNEITVQINAQQPQQMILPNDARNQVSVAHLIARHA